MSKFVKNLLTVLSLIGLLAWGACVFVGVLFISDCSLPVSIASGVGCALLMGFFFFLSCHYARPEAGADYGAAANTKKWIFIVIYWILSIVSAWYVLHAVACTTVYKEEIQSKAHDEFVALRTMTSDNSSTPGSYMAYVNERLVHYRDKNPNHYTDSKLIDKDIAVLNDMYVKNSGYPELKEQIRQFGEPASYSVENWDIFTVSTYLARLDSEKDKWDSEIVKCAENGLDAEKDLNMPQNMRQPYKPLEPTYSDLVSSLKTPSVKGIEIIGIVTILVLQIIIMLAWIAVGVSTRKGATGIHNNKIGVAVWGEKPQQKK